MERSPWKVCLRGRRGRRRHSRHYLLNRRPTSPSARARVMKEEFGCVLIAASAAN